MPFRYSGSKDELLPLLRQPPIGVKEIIEPFAGSARYGIYHQPQKLHLYEANTDVYELWRWLINEATEDELTSLEENKALFTKSVKELNLAQGPETLMRLTCSGIYVGQLSSWVMYPQHTVDFSLIKYLLPFFKNRTSLAGRDFRQSIEHNGKPGVLYFIDPPYLGSTGCYIDKSQKIDHDKVLTTTEIADFICALSSPVVFTYGNDAPEIFPQFNWTRLKLKSVPQISSGGSKVRSEWVAYINYYHELPDGTRFAA